MGRSAQAMFLLAAAVASGCAPGLFASPRTDPVLYPEPPRNAITFWGHACVYMDLGGVGIVTDPVFVSSYSLFHARKVPLPPAEAYDQAAIVLISHAHHDHLNVPTLRRFSSNVAILCPAPAAEYLEELGKAVRVMAPGDVFGFPGGRITAVPALHPGGRISLRARADGRALGYVIETPSITIYYSGDTEYFPGLEEIGNIYRPDVALLNVTSHLPPHDAIHAVISLDIPKIIPIHGGAYDGPRTRSQRRRREALISMLEPIAIPLAVGESVPLARLEKGPRASRTLVEPDSIPGGP